MEIKWLEDFLSLSSTLSFSRSAEHRNITQSALSRRVRQLEDWLGLPLFSRSTYPIRLTRAGQDFLPVAREVLDRLYHARDELRQQDTARTEVLTFATLNSLSLAFFPQWIRRLEAELGPLRTRFCDQHASLAGNIGSLVGGKSDFLLVYAHDSVPLPIDEERFVYCRLGREQLLPVSAPDARGRALHRIDPAAKAIRYLSYGTNTFFSEGLERLFDRRPLPLTTIYEDAMSAGLKAMVLAGRGVAWLPRNLIRDELAAGTMVPAGGAPWTLEVEIRLYRAAEPQHANVERFWEAVLRQSAEPAALAQVAV